MKHNLDKAGFKVEFAYDGEAGLQKIFDWKPDLVLLDIVMPGMDGYEVLEQLHAQDNQIPVIIISNSGQPVEIEKTRKLGAVDHLVKTEFTPEDVLAKVRFKLAPDDQSGVGEGERIDPVAADDVRDKKAKIMLVEDDKFLREICGRKLANEGYTVYPAVDGENALSNLESIMPDLILLDIVLPSVNGFEVLEKIRSHKNHKLAKVPVIMLSNLGQDEDISKAKKMGANDYLVKAHFTTEEIINKVDVLLSS
jgi:DNA-binding response OmpR family regulator